MSWHDFFYFSKGEKRGLVLLLSLIIVASVLLILNKKRYYEMTLQEQPPVATTDTVTSEVITASVPEQLAANKPKATQPVRSSVSTSTHRESVSERVNRMATQSRPKYPRQEKFAEGTIVELNTADTSLLKKVPGIGSSFAKRITGYRNLLGGYYSVTQLSEVYGVDEEKYNALSPWFTADPSLIKKVEVNVWSFDSINRHPYINYSQAKVIMQLRRQKGRLSGWENLELLEEFTESDKIKLKNYLSFE